eukprot:403363453
MSSIIDSLLGRDQKDTANIKGGEGSNFGQSSDKSQSDQTTGLSGGPNQQLNDQNYPGIERDFKQQLNTDNSGLKLQPGFTGQEDYYKRDFSQNLDKTLGNTIGSGYSTTQGVSQTKDLTSMDKNERMQHLQDVSAEQRDAKQGISFFEKTPLRKTGQETQTQSEFTSGMTGASGSLDRNLL